jgi:Phytanoyl-CoA dioxygenase (PhyH)./GSCFA family.
MFDRASTLIFNEGDSIQNLEALQLLIKAVFRTPQLDEIHLRLIDLLTTRTDWQGPPEKSVAALRQLISQLASEFPAEQHLWLCLLRDLANHEIETLENRRAYVPGGRFNPNAVYYPNPLNPQDPRSTFSELPYARVFKFVDKTTPIGSAGSCFAMEIAHRLQAEGYNYVITEPDPHSEKGYMNSCARWGTIFNVPSMRQLVEKAFRVRKLPKILWSHYPDGKLELRDPFREEITFSSLDEYEASYDSHIAAAREALLKCKVFVMTLGVNEVWRLKSDGTAFSRNPWRLASSLVERHIQTVEDNVNDLQKMLDLWRSHNPDLKLILSVSPVPLLATFRGDDSHVIASTCHSKSTLRLAAEEFVKRNRDVYYFPSYETVLYCTENPWEPDQRHVARHTVGKVMQLFDTMFVSDSDEMVVPASDMPVQIPEKRGTNFLLHPDWLDNFSGSMLALDAYFSAFQPEDDVCLMTWLPPETGVSTDEAMQRLADAIAELGYDADRIPDVLLIESVGQDQRAQLLQEVNAVIETGAASEANTLREARNQGVRVISPQPDILKVIGRHSLEKNAIVREVPQIKTLALNNHARIGQRDILLDELISGYEHFLKTKQTPHAAYVAMREWFCLSDGKFNDLMQQLYSEVYPPQALEVASGVLGEMRGGNLAKVTDALRQDGFYVFPDRLAPDICDRLMDFALQTEALLHSPPSDVPERHIYDPEHPLVAKYSFSDTSLISQPEVQRLVADPSILAVAQDYLGCSPILDLLTMWWSTAVWPEANSEAAQLFHFDMDRINFLKFFVYLTDVTEETGPHSYVRASHHRKPLALLRDGRFSDQEILRHYSSEDIIDIVAPRGTMFFADTRGFHKGVHLRAGHRLIFQMEFASSLFGAPYSPNLVDGEFGPELLQAVRRYPRTYELLKGERL